MSLSIKHNFGFTPYFGFTKSYQNSEVNILFDLSIESPK